MSVLTENVPQVVILVSNCLTSAYGVHEIPVVILVSVTVSGFALVMKIAKMAFLTMFGGKRNFKHGASSRPGRAAESRRRAASRRAATASRRDGAPRRKKQQGPGRIAVNVLGASLAAVGAVVTGIDDGGGGGGGGALAGSAAAGAAHQAAGAAALGGRVSLGASGRGRPILRRQSTHPPMVDKRRSLKRHATDNPHAPPEGWTRVWSVLHKRAYYLKRDGSRVWSLPAVARPVMKDQQGRERKEDENKGEAAGRAEEADANLAITED